MQHAAFVRGGQPGAELARDLDCLGRRQAADASHQRAQVFAVDVFHREEVEAVDLSEIVHAADVGMRHLPGQAHLVTEALDRGLALRERFGQELKGHLLIQAQVVGAIDLAHAAAAQ